MPTMLSFRVAKRRKFQGFCLEVTVSEFDEDAPSMFNGLRVGQLFISKVKHG